MDPHDDGWTEGHQENAEEAYAEALAMSAARVSLIRKMIEEHLGREVDDGMLAYELGILLGTLKRHGDPKPAARRRHPDRQP